MLLNKGSAKDKHGVSERYAKENCLFGRNGRLRNRNLDHNPYQDWRLEWQFSSNYNSDLVFVFDRRIQSLQGETIYFSLYLSVYIYIYTFSNTNLVKYFFSTHYSSWNTRLHLSRTCTIDLSNIIYQLNKQIHKSKCTWSKAK